jgi:tRNA G46 methylase TrmB
MSRLDSVIRRLQAQRACLEWAAELIAPLPGVILEIGLGKGRTFDHLRQIMPGREIFVFERKVAPGAEAKPDGAHLVLGDLCDTLPSVASRFANAAALIHSDIGSGNARITEDLAGFLSDHLPRLMGHGAMLVSDQELTPQGLTRLPPPAGVAQARYYLYRAT